MYNCPLSSRQRYFANIAQTDRKRHQPDNQGIPEKQIKPGRVGNRMIQRVFIAEQDGKTRMLLNELNVAHHL